MQFALRVPIVRALRHRLKDNVAIAESLDIVDFDIVSAIARR